jgi:hypothetical protein
VLQWAWSKGPVLITMSACVRDLPDVGFVHMHPVKPPDHEP